MIAVLRSELYRTLTLRSGWVSIALSIALAVAFGWFDTAFWSLFAGPGSFGLAVATTAQHYQHRTSLLLFLGHRAGCRSSPPSASTPPPSRSRSP